MEGGQTFELVLPDWGTKDTIRRSHLPFVLWEVGDQPLLAHWLDEAFNQGCTKVILKVADRPAEVRNFCENSTLWPIDIQVQAVKSTSSDQQGYFVNKLPWQSAQVREPGDGWDFIDFWWDLECNWFDHNRELLANPANFVSIGRYCQIHPSVELIAPYWIGDQVSIGPGCRIGPFAAIGHGSILAGKSLVESSRIDANTYLAPDTELKDAYLEGPRLFNRRLMALADGLDAVIAGQVKDEEQTRVGFWQKVRALKLLLRYRPMALASLKTGQTRQIVTLTGENYTLINSPDPFVERWLLLKKVIAGEFPLVGIPPYDKSQLEGIDSEWRECLARSPVGAFGLSDANCLPASSMDERIIHDVYQANCNAEQEISSIVLNYIRR